MSDKKTVTIVINTLNRAKLLKNTLESFRSLDYKNFEVVVVNGPSTDATNRLLDAWQDKIKIGHCPEANLSMSRNIGIAMASGEFVAFIDDDAIPEPEWLCQAIAGFENESIGATGGKVFDYTGYGYQYQYATANRLGNARWYLTSPSPQHCFPHSFEFPYLQGTNTIFRRKALLQIGGFDEEYIYYLDETEVCLRLMDAGFIIRQLPQAYVHHKYASSHIRIISETRRTPIYRYPVLKSKFYFSNRYAKPYLSQEEIDADNENFIRDHRNSVEFHVKHGDLTEMHKVQFEEHVVLAQTAANTTPKMISQQLLAQHQSQFRLFPVLCPKEKKLVIVLLCEDYPPNLLGGIARFTQDKATALAAEGHKVHVIACGESFNTVDLEEGVWVHRIVPQFYHLTDEASRLKIPQSHWDQSQSFLAEIDRIATHRSIDIVEAPIWNVVGIAPLLSKRYKLITTLQTTLKLSLPSRPDLLENAQLYKDFIQPVINLEQMMIEESDYVLGSSRGIIAEVEKAYEMHIPSQKLSIINYGMPDWRKKELSTMKPNNKMRLLFVGRLETRKGIDILLELVPQLLEAYPQLEVNIVGDDSLAVVNGKTYREIFESTASTSIKDKVKFHGKLSEELLRYHYATCDIFIAPSRFESFGLIFVEAMMFSKPVVGCLTGGISEVVSNGETGLLAQPGDKHSLYECIKKLIEDSELRLKLGVNGRARYEKLFSAQEMAKNCLTVYSQL